MKEVENLQKPQKQALNIPVVRHSLLCNIFGHKFITEKEYIKEPLNGDTVNDILNGIRHGTNFAAVEMELQRKVLLHKEETKYIKTYCKRCGMVV